MNCIVSIYAESLMSELRKRGFVLRQEKYKKKMLIGLWKKKKENIKIIVPSIVR
jgi:hypothetical protein